MPERPSVYVVDDDPDFRRAVIWLLESIGHRVQGYEAAEDFLVDFRKGGYGCLLTDMRMPDKSGLDLLETLREERPEFPVIIMTAYGTVKSGVRAMKLGALDFIEKPFEDQQLLDLVNKALEQAKHEKREQGERQNLLKSIDGLSQREEEVLAEIMDGTPVDQIAKKLNIGGKTIETYRSRILAKTGFKKTSDLRALLERYSIKVKTGV